MRMLDIEALFLAHKDLAGPVVGAMVFSESLAAVGLAVPATPLMLLVGAYLALGVLDPYSVIPWAIAGAFFGYSASYEIGRWAGPSICRKWPLNRFRKSAARARLFFRRYGSGSIIAGRFLGPVQSTMPLVAGIMIMNRRRFYGSNAISTIIWVPVLLAPGFLAVRGNRSIEEHYLAFSVGVALILFIGFLVAKAVKRRHVRRRRNPARTGPPLSCPVRETPV
jgi:membrane protein DedA with SNARE-associated domain